MLPTTWAGRSRVCRGEVIAGAQTHQDHVPGPRNPVWITARNRAEMGEHAAALEAACTAISDLAAAPAVVRPAALDGDGVRAKNQLEMAGSDLMSALDC